MTTPINHAAAVAAAERWLRAALKQAAKRMED